MKIGKIYAIKSPHTNKVYYGCTFQKYISSRFHNHKSAHKEYLAGKKPYCTSYELFKNGDCHIELISKHENVSREQLLKIEGECVLNDTNSVNKVINGTSEKETKKKCYEKRRDYYLERMKKYRENNREKIKEGKKRYNELNREKIKEKKHAYYLLKKNK